MENTIEAREDTAKRLDGLTPQQLISEIRQIAVQYEREVPGKRRHWPESLRARVMALRRLGVSPAILAEAVPIPKATLYLWCRDRDRGPRRTTELAKDSREPRGRFRQVTPVPAVPTVRTGATVTCRPAPVQPLEV